MYNNDAVQQASPPPAFVGEVLAHLVRLLPLALASPAGAATFIECLQPFEVRMYKQYGPRQRETPIISMSKPWEPLPSSYYDTDIVDENIGERIGHNISTR